MTPAEQLARVKEALGCIIIGLIVSSILYGITVLQTYIYYKENPKDLVRVKVLVGIVFFLDTVASASITAGAFIFFVNDFGRQATLVNTPPSLALETAANALIATLTQLFFAYRLYIVSRKNRVLVSVIVSPNPNLVHATVQLLTRAVGKLVLAILSLGPAAWTAVFFLGASSLFNLGLPKVRVIASLATGLPAICDILIAWGLCYYLHTSRSGFKKSDTVIDRLMLYTIECGALTAVCQTCILVTFAALPGRIIFIPFQLVVGKLYCNALLASLNVRWRIRELNSVATPDAATRALQPGSGTTDPLSGQYRGGQTVDKDKDKDTDLSPTIEVSFGGVASTSTGTGTTSYSPEVLHNELHSYSPGMTLREVHSRNSSGNGAPGAEERKVQTTA
ncbi:hypothetical protein LXA43DRAFT_1111420 [Ganoderma leucocontextum]|nr:hypothetical protein LXA43DRAFT_1111420 [Ganoderma leucocontextum]